MNVEKAYILTVQVEQEANGRWNSTVPDLAGLIYTADDRRVALQGLREMAPGYLKSISDDGRPVPSFHGSQLYEAGLILAVTIDS